MSVGWLEGTETAPTAREVGSQARVVSEVWREPSQLGRFKSDVSRYSSYDLRTSQLDLDSPFSLYLNSIVPDRRLLEPSRDILGRNGPQVTKANARFSSVTYGGMLDIYKRGSWRYG